MALFGKKSEPQFDLAKLPEELKALIAKAADERTKFAQQVGKAKTVTDKLASLEEPLGMLQTKADAAMSRLIAVEERATVIESMAHQLDDISRSLSSTSTQQQETHAAYTNISKDIADLNAIAGGLKTSVNTALMIRQELEAAASPQGPVADIRARLDKLREEFLNYSHDVQSARDQHENLKRASEEAMARTGQARDVGQRVTAALDEAATRVAKMEVQLAELSKLQQLAPRAEQDVQALNALADHVAAKTRILEKQREVVERAAAMAARVDDQVWDLDSRVKKLDQDRKKIKDTQEALTDLQDLLRRIETRTQEVRAFQQAGEKESALQLSKFAGIRDDMKQSLAQFDMEKRGLDAVNQRIVDMRGALTDFERRFGDLQSTNQAIAQGQARADDLGAKLTTLAADVMRVSEQAERARAAEITLERAEGNAQRITKQLDSLQAAYPDLQALARDVGELKSVRESVLDAIERVRGARTELERGLQTQSEARAMVAGMEGSVNALRQKVALVDERAPAVERVAQFAEAAVAAQRELEARREFVDQLERRVAQLGSLSTELETRAHTLEERRAAFADLESRTESLRGRLDDADRRFGGVAARAGETEKIEARIASIASMAQTAEERMNQMSRAVDDSTAREAKITEQSSRMDRLGRELEQREKTLQQASENLEKAAQLRQSAMEAAQVLEDQGRKLAGSIAGAEAQADRVSGLADQLEARAGGLRLAEKRLTSFEEKLVQLERSEQALAKSMEGLEARSKSVDAVRGELTRIFELVEHTMEDVRAISAARQDVHSARTALDDVLQRAAAVDQRAAGIDKRSREIDLAEQRIARLDALLTDVRASLEALQSQKVTVDHVLEKASQLTFVAKEAEALITTLREERDLTSKVHEGLKQMRAEERESKAG